VTDTGETPALAAGPVQNVVIFGGRMSDADRRSLEDGFTVALSSRGVHATPSYTLFPGSVPSQPAAEPNIQRGGYDGVLVSTPRRAGDPASTDTTVEFETKLWDPSGGGKLIWSNVTETADSASAPNGLDGLLSSVMAAMVRAGVLPQS
jgi:hypothetical protein